MSDAKYHGTYWISSVKMTFSVEVEDNVITDAAPIAKRFVGQPFENLYRWMNAQGGLRLERIRETT
jgi:hypothetical protein